MRWIRNILMVMILAVLIVPVHGVAASTFAGQNGQIAFSKADGIWTVRPNGSQAQLLSGRMISDLVWSPDGTRLAFNEQQLNGTTRLRVMNASTGAVKNVTRQSGISDSEPVWSYDGKQLAFVRTKQRFSEKQSAIFTVKADGEELKNITSWSTDKSYRVPSWGPNNKRLAYQEITDSSARIFIKNFANGSLRELTTLSDVSQPPLLAWNRLFGGF